MALASWKRPLILTLILLLCGAGAWISNGLLQLHDGVPPGTTSVGQLIVRLCHSDSEESSGCAASAQSAWSEIHLPIPHHPINLPVAFLAIAYFIALGVWYAFVGEARPRWKPLRWLPIAIAGAAIYASIFFVGLMAMGRAPWCGGCVTVHLLNLLLVISIALSRRWSHDSAAMDGVISCRQSGAVIGFAILLIGVLYTARSRRILLTNQVADLQPYQRIVESVQKNTRLMMDAYTGQPINDIVLRPDEMNPAATHQLVVFLDFECPGCLMTADFIHREVEQDFGGKLNVIVRHYPLCRACNPNAPKTIHADACKAAYAAEAARAVGGKPAFDRMCDSLFLDQQYLGSTLDRDLAIQAGIDPDAFLKKLDDPAVKQRVSGDIASGHALHVTNTPTVFLDGRLVPQLCMTPEFWKAAANMPATQP
jgi:protein-disulfide isomerase